MPKTTFSVTVDTLQAVPDKDLGEFVTNAMRNEQQRYAPDSHITHASISVAMVERSETISDVLAEAPIEVEEDGEVPDPSTDGDANDDGNEDIEKTGGNAHQNPTNKGPFG